MTVRVVCKLDVLNLGTYCIMLRWELCYTTPDLETQNYFLFNLCGGKKHAYLHTPLLLLAS